jgi:hypothetical protein
MGAFPILAYGVTTGLMTVANGIADCFDNSLLIGGKLVHAPHVSAPTMHRLWYELPGQGATPVTRYSPRLEVERRRLRRQRECLIHNAVLSNSNVGAAFAQ